MNKRRDIVPNNLKEYRLKCGLTQKQVAQYLGLTNEVSICHWEQGKNIPNLFNLFKLSNLYAISSEELYSQTVASIKRELLLNYPDKDI